MMWKTEQAESTKLLNAALKSYQTGRITPLLKEELKYHIQYRRMSEGKDELILTEETRTDETQPLRPEELERVQKRREQNRQASERFRNKKKSQTQSLEQLRSELEDRNFELKAEVQKLQTERDHLYSEVTNLLQSKNNTAGHIVPLDVVI